MGFAVLLSFSPRHEAPEFGTVVGKGFKFCSSKIVLERFYSYKRKN